MIAGLAADPRDKIGILFYQATITMLPDVESHAPKLVFAGPTGAGKTTAIASVADVPPVSTEMPLTSGAMGEKTLTTVAFDFASVRLDGSETLMLYGLPGQEHFEFMRPIVLAGALGTILVLNGADADLAAQCAHWMRAIRDVDDRMPVVVGVTQTENNPSFDIAVVRGVLRAQNATVPVFTFDARDKAQTSQLIRALLLQLD